MIEWWSSLLLEKQIFYAIGLASIKILALEKRAIKQAEADGLLFVGTAEAEGLNAPSRRDGWRPGDPDEKEDRINTCAGAPGAQNMLITEQLPNLVHEQVSAISNLKIDKVTVWDSGRNGDGKTGTAGFLSGLISALPPLHELARNAGLDLPTYLGELQQEAERRQSGGKESDDTGEKRVPASKSNG